MVFPTIAYLKGFRPSLTELKDSVCLRLSPREDSVPVPWRGRIGIQGGVSNFQGQSWVGAGHHPALIFLQLEMTATNEVGRLKSFSLLYNTFMSNSQSIRF